MINKIIVEVALTINRYSVKELEHFHKGEFLYHFTILHILSPVCILEESERPAVGLELHVEAAFKSLAPISRGRNAFNIEEKVNSQVTSKWYRVPFIS